MNRYEVTFTDGTDTRTSFTWAEDAEAARARIAEEVEGNPQIWLGWTATVG